MLDNSVVDISVSQESRKSMVQIVNWQLSINLDTRYTDYVAEWLVCQQVKIIKGWWKHKAVYLVHYDKGTMASVHGHPYQRSSIVRGVFLFLGSSHKEEKR